MSRDPLRDDEAEVSVIGAMVLDPLAAQLALKDLAASDFLNPAHATLFRAIGDVIQAREAVDATLLIAALREQGILGAVGGADAVVRMISSVPSTANTPHYIGIVRDLSLRRAVISAATAYGEAARNGGDQAAFESLLRAREARDATSEPTKVQRASRWDLAVRMTQEAWPPPTEMVERVFTRPSVNLVFGPAGSGKSFAMLQFALDLVMGGGAFMGFEEYQILPRQTAAGSFDPAPPEKCLWIFGSEDSPQRMDVRSRKTFLSGPHADKPVPEDRFVYLTPPPGIYLGDARGWEWLDKLILTEKPTLLVCDTVSSLKSGSMNMSDNDHVGEFIRHFHHYRDQLSLTTILNHHSKKGGADPKDMSADKADTMLGAQAWRSQADGVLMIRAKDGDVEHADVRLLKSKDLERPIPHLAVCLNRELGRFEPRDPDEEAAPEKPMGRPSKCSLAAVLALRPLNPGGVPFESLWATLGCAERTWKNNRADIQTQLLALGHTVIAGSLKWGNASQSLP